MSTKNFNEINAIASNVKALMEKTKEAHLDRKSEAYKAAIDEYHKIIEDGIATLVEKGIGNSLIDRELITKIANSAQGDWILDDWFDPTRFHDEAERLDYISTFKNVLPSTFLYENNSTNASEALLCLEREGIHLIGIVEKELSIGAVLKRKAICWKLSCAE